MTIDWQKRAQAAERTVDVLTRKVLAMYSSETSSTFQRQLTRARERQERALRRREVMEVRAAELANYSSGLEIEVAERTQALRAILDNVTSGFLVVDASLVVSSGFTKSCHELFGTKVVPGRTLPELLRIEDSRLRAQLEMSVEQIFADVFPDEISVELVPKRFPIGERVLRVDARVIRRDGAIAELLFTVSDITSLERAERDAKDNHVLVGILKERDAFGAFAVDTRELFSASRDALAEPGQVFVRRALHTVKGNAAAFELDAVVSTIHAIEANDEITWEHIAEAEQCMRGFVERHQGVLEIEYEGQLQQSFEVAESSLGELHAMIRRHEKEPSLIVESWAAGLVCKRADQLVGPLASFASKLAERLEKEVEFTLRGGETLVDALRTRPIFQVIPHMLRNAVDHGIELPDERGPKRPRGHVELSIEDRGAIWAFIVSDDGRGIDPELVAAHALERGFVTAEGAASLTRDEKLALIFRDGLSTAAVATEISGRGVGMAAVDAAVKHQGGSIRIESTPGVGTRLLLLVPKPSALAASAPLAA